MKSENGSTRQDGLSLLRFHVEEAGADAKLIQHGPLGVAFHRRHPVFTIPVASITAHATVRGFNIIYTKCIRLVCMSYLGLEYFKFT
jgi:hypothetical protein